MHKPVLYSKALLKFNIVATPVKSSEINLRICAIVEVYLTKRTSIHYSKPKFNSRFL